MPKNALSVVAIATAVVVLVAGAALLTRATDDDGQPAQVLGRSLDRTTTTDAPDLETSTTAFGDSTTSIPVVTIDVGTTTTAPASPTTAKATTTTTPPPHQRTVEKADVTSAFDYQADSSSAMSTSDATPPHDPFVFKTLGSNVDNNDYAELKAEMANQTGRDIAFPDGLVLRFLINRDGKLFRTVELRFPDTMSLPPGGSLEVESQTPLNDQYGHFDFSGEVTVEYR